MVSKVLSVRGAGLAAGLGGMLALIPAVYSVVGVVPGLGYSPSSLTPSPLIRLLVSFLASPVYPGPVVSTVVESLLSVGAVIVLAAWV